jgi:F-type H+-transporting ATPase subunit b
MTGSFATAVRTFIVLLLLATAGGVAQAQSHEPEAKVETAVEHGVEAATGGDVGLPADAHGGGHGGVDYNKPPLPGSTPGLMELFIYSLILFLGFVFVARSFVWKPLISALDEREGRINRAQEEAERANAEAARLLALHQQKMNEVQEQVKGIVAQARQQADTEKSQIIASAEAEAKALRDRALADIRQAREEAMAGLAATVDRQVGLATEHILGHRLN